jgi:plasmid maintenance system antidote protein VapI/Zn-dependent peptidase ImmA (M78 family)
MAENHDFRPDWASAPGETIADILGEQHLSLSEFGLRIGQTQEYVKNLLQGRATITLAIARRLERVLGASVEFWMSRDFQYREDTTRLSITDKEWLNELPVGDMIKFGWLKATPHPSQEISACLKFFEVPSVSAWRQTYANLQEMAAFRTSPSFDSRPASVASWLRQGEIEGGGIDCLPWNPAQFQESLSNIRSLTREKDPKRFIPALQNLCAAGGVAVVILRAPNGCRASGATRFLSPNKALLLLSFRYLSDDQFWFSFFHEAGHLLLHGDRLFLEGVGTPSTKEEEEANDFAARVLIPPEFHHALLRLPLDGREVIRFSRRVGVSPGIVVGQLQHHKKITHRQLNSLKRRYKWVE